MSAVKDALPERLWLVGCGKMGGAMLQGWLQAGLDPAKVEIVEPDPAGREAWAAKGVNVHAEVAGLPDEPEPAVVVLAVKPQVMPRALEALSGRVPQSALVISIAAGVEIAAFEAAFPGNPVVRVMPNTPAAVGRGISVLCANARTSERQRAQAEGLAAAVGRTAWIEDEASMHAVTALSGGGPAYVFHLAEAMAEAGVAAGLPENLAAELAAATVAGAGALMDASGEDPAQLRVNVTSKGGTTAEALQVLMDEERGFVPLLREAVAAAARRSEELARGPG